MAPNVDPNDLVKKETWEPKNLIDTDDKGKDKFILSNPEMLSLMQYVWTGCLLPTTADEYGRRMGIKASFPTDVNKEFLHLLEEYKKE